LNYIIFGGSGFIASHLISLIKSECLKEGDRIHALDLVMPGEEGCVPGAVERIDGVSYSRCDVRKPISVEGLEPSPEDIIFNLAAVHRTPGHKDIEYFETNIRGAENVTAFASRHGVPRILFTSSIAVYGSGEDVIFNLAAVHRTPGHKDIEYFETNIRGAENVTAYATRHGVPRILFTSSIAVYSSGEDMKTEASLPAPSSAYGASKLAAEKIHEIWRAGGGNRRLVTLRPGVVFGKGERGNFSRMSKGIKGRYFFYAGRKDTIKACVYVKDLARFMKLKIIDSAAPGFELFNCSYFPAPTVEAICEEMKAAMGLKRKTLMMPSWLLKGAAVAAVPLGGKNLGLHPARVRKLMVSTNISGKRMAESGRKFGYTLREALEDWQKDCGGAVME
jgi:nucleoside-diphosphate-sugar epimerase